MTDEIWKDVPGCEGRYQVSNLGRVRSVDCFVRAVSKRGLEHQRFSPGKVLRAGGCRGYLIVHLSGFGTIGVHILVARAHVAGGAPGLEVNHKDGDKHNNIATNLEWGTKSHNQLHAVETGLKEQAIPVCHPVTGRRFPSIRQAEAAHGKQAREWPRA